MTMRIFPFLLLLLFGPLVEAQVQTGKASFYADKFEGKPTASGQKYRASKLTAAHKTLPFGTRVKVTNQDNGKSVVVEINDRGPWVEERIIDVSKRAAEELGFVNKGITDVELEVVDPGDGKAKEQLRMIDQVSVDEKEFYTFEPKRLTPKGFGVQIGTYQELVNLMRLADHLKNAYKDEITIQVKAINGIKYYGLILGKFPNRGKAEQFREELRAQYPDAFLVEFDRQ
jgi:rare lipoprotein A